MAKNHRGKKSPRKMHTHTRKRPSESVRYVHDTVYFPPIQYLSFSEESIQRQLGRYEMMQEPANPSAPHSKDFAPAEWYTYAGGPVYYPSMLEMAQAEVAAEYEAQVGLDGATYYSPRREHFAHHPQPNTPEAVEVGGTTYDSPHQHHLDLVPYPRPLPSEKEGGEYVSGYIEGYHHPQIEHQTRDWWALFRDTTGELYVLDSVKAERAKQVEETRRFFEESMARGEGISEEKEKWTPERYFAPYRGSEEEPCAELEVQREEEALGDRVVVEETECRGRDDWECDFCGVECFCRNLSD